MILRLEKEWMNYPAGFEPLYISDAKGLELIDRGIAVDIDAELLEEPETEVDILEFINNDDSEDLDDEIKEFEEEDITEEDDSESGKEEKSVDNPPVDKMIKNPFKKKGRGRPKKRK